MCFAGEIPFPSYYLDLIDNCGLDDKKSGKRRRKKNYILKSPRDKESKKKRTRERAERLQNTLQVQAVRNRRELFSLG